MANHKATLSTSPRGSADSGAYELARRSRVDGDTTRSPLPNGTMIIDLTDDGDEASSFLPPPPKRLKFYGSPRKSSAVDNSRWTGGSDEGEMRGGDGQEATV